MRSRIKSALIFAVMVMAVTACGRDDSKAIPEPYRTEITKLRDRNIEIGKRCQDLQRELQSLQSESQWNSSRIQSDAAQALLSSGLVHGYAVNLDSLRIEKKK